MHYFSCSGGPGVVSIKSVLGHIKPNMCFCIRWDLRVTYCIPVRSWCETSTHYFSSSGEPGVVSIKSVLGHIILNLCVLHPVGSESHVSHSGASEA
jgi:hypothetical protein